MTQLGTRLSIAATENSMAAMAYGRSIRMAMGEFKKAQLRRSDSQIGRYDNRGTRPNKENHPTRNNGGQSRKETVKEATLKTAVKSAAPIGAALKVMAKRAKKVKV